MNDATPERADHSEPETGPVLTPPSASAAAPPAAPATVAAPGPTAYPPPQPQQPRLTRIAALVGIVAGSVFTVAVIFGTGFFVGKNVGDDGSRHPHRGPVMVHSGPAMMPMGPPVGFERGPGFPGPFGPGGPMIDTPRPPAAPAAPQRP
ncbi:hypothetical protein FHR72_003722 [Mycolicibacterium iranicum]|uniref:Uncharacterized protein n=1 Tax=Mycolicibacterium iranicum TaxID=912594 RepID=A0A839QDG0_MYCIR|nr:hypothetical protein [Mycolicibacterium iranicum]MBB2992226.1 hypothetical protein [Mycolicibacterium iranicum]